MLRDELNNLVRRRSQKTISEADDREIYGALLEYTKEKLEQTPAIQGSKKLYYISAEFLIGKLLSNNLINLGLYDEVAELLKENGKDLAHIEEIEPVNTRFLKPISSLELLGG